MKHGKDYLTDKPGIITLEQLAEVKKVQQQTKRIYSIMYSERFENKGTEKASKLVAAGRHRESDSNVNLAPHRIANNVGKSGWLYDPIGFWDKKRYGGILTDIGSHQFDQYLHFTGSTEADGSNVAGRQCSSSGQTFIRRFWRCDVKWQWRYRLHSC
jgi:predicted dehydrogenase